jgi:cell division septum initiation protein DivIVA
MGDKQSPRNPNITAREACEIGTHIRDLQQERDHLRMAAESEAKRGDELAARIIELENWIESNCYDMPGEASRRARDVLLRREPAQSLLLNNADVLGHTAIHVLGVDLGSSGFALGYNSAAKRIQAEADKLRQEANNEPAIPQR